MSHIFRVECLFRSCVRSFNSFVLATALSRVRYWYLWCHFYHIPIAFRPLFSSIIWSNHCHSYSISCCLVRLPFLVDAFVPVDAQAFSFHFIDFSTQPRILNKKQKKKKKKQITIRANFNWWCWRYIQWSFFVVSFSFQFIQRSFYLFALFCFWVAWISMKMINDDDDIDFFGFCFFLTSLL